MEDGKNIMRAFATQYGIQLEVWDAALVLDEQWLLDAGPAYEWDTPIPQEVCNRLPKHYRFHARRWLCMRLGIKGKRQVLPVAVDVVIRARWPEASGKYTGFQSSEGTEWCMLSISVHSFVCVVCTMM
jgi:hypothetical protein